MPKKRKISVIVDSVQDCTSMALITASTGIMCACKPFILRNDAGRWTYHNAVPDVHHLRPEGAGSWRSQGARSWRASPASSSRPFSSSAMIKPLNLSLLHWIRYISVPRLSPCPLIGCRCWHLPKMTAFCRRINNLFAYRKYAIGRGRAPQQTLSTDDQVSSSEQSFFLVSWSCLMLQKLEPVTRIISGLLLLDRRRETHLHRHVHRALGTSVLGRKRWVRRTSANLNQFLSVSLGCKFLSGWVLL